jgi:hypothetical protein
MTFAALTRNRIPSPLVILVETANRLMSAIPLSEGRTSGTLHS